MKRMSEREALGANPHGGVPFQDPFYGALWGAYTACCPSFSGPHRPYRMSQTQRSQPGPLNDRINGLGTTSPQVFKYLPTELSQALHHEIISHCIVRGGGECLWRHPAACGIGRYEEKRGLRRVQSSACCRVDTRSSFRATALTEHTKSNKHRPASATYKVFLKTQRGPHCVVPQDGGGGGARYHKADWWGQKSGLVYGAARVTWECQHNGWAESKTNRSLETFTNMQRQQQTNK